MTRRLLPLVTLASLLSLVGATSAQEGPVGALRGVLVDVDYGVPLADARVTVVEAAQNRTTGPDGSFVFDRLPAGAYTVVFAKDGYGRVTRSGIVVTAGKLSEIRAELSLEVVELDEMVVTGTDLLEGTEIALLEVRADAVTVQDAVSAELLGKAGVGDAAGALRLVVGASVADGKYATVRGLSDRYTGTTLNGVRVPSADPRKRAVQMDLFPTGTIDSVTVTKTFTPDLQGDFSGGGVDIVTKSIPEERIAKISVSGEYSSLATGEDAFLTYRGGGISWSGFESGDRALPDAAKSPPSDAPAPVNYSRIDDNRPGGTRITSEELARRIGIAEQYDAFTRSFTPVIGTSRDAPGASFGLSGVWGDRWDTTSGLFGALAALTYSRKYDFYEGAVNDRVDVQVDPETNTPQFTRTAREDSRGSEELLIGALGTLDWKVGDDHEYSVRFIGNQSAEDEARFQTEDRGTTLQNQSLKYTQRSLASLQVHGGHRWPDLLASSGARGFSGLELDWFAAGNLTRQYEPDVRFFRNVFDPTTNTAFFEIGAVPDTLKTRRIFRDIHERSEQASLNLVLPFTQWSDAEGRLKAGIYHEGSTREYDQNSFFYSFQFSQPGSNEQAAVNNAYGSAVLSGPDALWTDFFLAPERIGLSENRCEPPTTAFQDRTCAQPSQLLWYANRLADDVVYDGDQTIQAAYAMGDLPLSSKVRLVGGARWESTDLSIVPINEAFGRVSVAFRNENGTYVVDPNVPQEEAVADVSDASWLPSLGLVWEVAPRMNLRGSWSRTLARPTYRELAPVGTEEFLAGDSFLGNPDLRLSAVENWDVRWEWFQDEGDVLAASLFEKDITDPIELISFVAAGTTYIQPVNYETGRAKGIELEARASLGRWARWLRGIVVGGNYSRIDSEVDIPAEERQNLAVFGLGSDTRRLQGQPADVFNFNITYDNERTGTSASLFYNRTGDTLLTGASVGQDGGIPNVFDVAYGVFDVSVSQKIDGATVTLRGKNLLSPDRESVYRLPTGEERFKTRRETPVLISLSVAYAW